MAERRFGLEHEFLVWSGEQLVDFAALLPDVIGDGRQLHPTEGARYRTTSGVSLQADGKAAEIATPPVSESAEAVRELDTWARRATWEMRNLLPRGLRLEGASTHFSVSVADDACRAVARRYARTFAPAMMLLLDRAHSPGLLVRPRPGRVELCGEFVEGDQRRAATTFAIASVLAVADSARHEPPTIDVHLEPAVRRFGWYVDRAAFGCDLYDDGRRALLRLADGRRIHAQQLVECCWESARRQVEDWLDPGDVEHVDRVVSGDRPIPLEAITADPSWTPRVGGSGEGDFLRTRRRGRYRVGVHLTTWDFAAFELRSPTRTAIVSIPYDLRGRFLDLLDRGHLDDVFEAFLSTAESGRVLRNHEQTEQPGLFDEVDPGPRLLPRDDPGKGGPDGDPTIVKPVLVPAGGGVLAPRPADEPEVTLTTGATASSTLDADLEPGRPATLRAADTHAGSFHVGPGDPSGTEQAAEAALSGPAAEESAAASTDSSADSTATHEVDAEPGRPATLRAADTHAGSFHIDPGGSPPPSQDSGSWAGTGTADRNNGAAPWWKNWKIAGAVAAVLAIAVGIAVALSGGGGDEEAGTSSTEPDPAVVADDGDGVAQETETSDAATSDGQPEATETSDAATSDGQPEATETSDAATSDDDEDDIASGLEEAAFDFDAVTIESVDVAVVEDGGTTRAIYEITFGSAFVRDTDVDNVTLQAQLQNLEGGVFIVEIRIEAGEARLSGIEVDNGDVSGLDGVAGGFADGGLTATLSGPLSDDFLAAEGDFFGTVNILRDTDFMQSSDVIGVPRDTP